MILIREVMHCRPGKVREMVDKFKGLSAAAQQMGFPPFRIYTDVSAEQFWTVVLQGEAENVGAFLDMERTVMANAQAQKAMEGYHDLVVSGRREIYQVEG